jgi:hypothetical protein
LEQKTSREVVKVYEKPPASSELLKTTLNLFIFPLKILACLDPDPHAHLDKGFNEDP